MGLAIELFAVGFGGFLGTISRYLVSKQVGGLLGSFPFGTLVVNVTGSFVIGFIMYSVLNGRVVSSEMRSFAVIGFIGGFTTMSSFAFESVRLFELREYWLVGANVTLNVLLSFLAVVAGRELAIYLTR